MYPNFHFAALTEFKKGFMRPCRCFLISHLTNPFPQTKTLLDSRFIYDFCHGNILDELHSLVPPKQAFRARSYSATYTRSIHPYSRCIGKEEVPRKQILP